MKKYTVDIIQEKFDELFDGKSPIKLLDSYEYKNRSSILGYTCPEYSDEVHERTGEFLLRRINRKNKTLDYCPEMIPDPMEKYIKAVTERYGSFPYEITGKYKGVNKPIEMTCLRCDTHLDKVRPNHLLAYSKGESKIPPCYECAKKAQSIRRMSSLQEYLNDIEKLTGKGKGYNIINPSKKDIEFFNRSEKHTHQCQVCLYKWEAIPANIYNSIKNLNTRTCPQCNDMVRMDIDFDVWLEENRPTLKLLNLDGREFFMNKTQTFACTVCDDTIFEAHPYNIYTGSGCHKCNGFGGITSKYENRIYEYLVNDLNVDPDNIILNSRKILGDGKELDIYLREEKIAIEVNGLYYHSHRYKDKDYHLEKTKRASGKGIRLLHFYTDEIDSKPDIIKDKLRHLLGKTENRIYARKCEVKLVDTKVKGEFLNNNHIQGSDRSNLNMGLFHDDELVAVMTFSKGRISTGHSPSSNKMELSRYATPLNYSIVGGFSKLLKHSIEYIKRNFPTMSVIYTYADKDISAGNLYKQNNFVHVRDSRPSYFYIDKNDRNLRHHRFKFRKSELKKLFPDIYSGDLTEFEIMDQTEYLRVYNTGNMYFELDIS